MNTIIKHYSISNFLNYSEVEQAFVGPLENSLDADLSGLVSTVLSGNPALVNTRIDVDGNGFETRTITALI